MERLKSSETKNYKPQKDSLEFVLSFKEKPSPVTLMSQLKPIRTVKLKKDRNKINRQKNRGKFLRNSAGLTHNETMIRKYMKKMVARVYDNAHPYGGGDLYICLIISSIAKSKKQSNRAIKRPQ
jgi:hypothetical protein